LRSELLLPFAHTAATVRLPSTAGRTCSPRCAAVGLLCHAGSTAALLAATLGARRRPLLAHCSTALFRGGPAAAALLLRRARTAVLFGATTAPLFRLRRRPQTLLRATAALLVRTPPPLRLRRSRVTTAPPALFRPRRRPATLFGAATALARGRGPALFGAASTLW
jgi:hypothetical protein